VHGFLRFVGVLNAAVWLGAACFFTLVAGPAFFSAEMLSFLPRPHAGRAAEVILQRLFLLQQGCAVIALIHLGLEHFHSGRAVEKLTLALLVCLLGFGLAGGQWLLPKMHELQRVRYGAQTTPAQKQQAAAEFASWHRASRVADLAALAALMFYLWRLTRPAGGPRFAPLDKFKR